MIIYTWLIIGVALIGTYFVIRNRVEGFYLWVMSNAGLIRINYADGHYAESFLFTVYLGLAIYGIYEMEDKEKPEVSSTPCLTSAYEELERAREQFRFLGYVQLFEEANRIEWCDDCDVSWSVRFWKTEECFLCKDHLEKNVKRLEKRVSKLVMASKEACDKASAAFRDLKEAKKLVERNLPTIQGHLKSGDIF